MFGIPPTLVVFAAGLLLNIAGFIVNGAWTILNLRMEQRQDKKLSEKLSEFEKQSEQRFASVEQFSNVERRVSDLEAIV